jgi:hypothetical protein
LATLREYTIIAIIKWRELQSVDELKLFNADGEKGARLLANGDGGLFALLRHSGRPSWRNAPICTVRL